MLNFAQQVFHILSKYKYSLSYPWIEHTATFFGHCLLLQLWGSKEVGLTVRRSWRFLAPKSENRKCQREMLVSARTSVVKQSAVSSLHAKAASVTRFTFNPPSECARVKSDLHGGAGEGVHNTLGQWARGRRFHHLLVLWSRHWSQNAHYNLIRSWFLTADKVLLKLFYCMCQWHFYLFDLECGEHCPCQYYLDKHTGPSTLLEYWASAR